LIEFDIRQSGYYFNAGKYLKLFEKKKEGKIKVVKLTLLGEKVFKLNYKERQLKIVELILEHKIFRYFFTYIITNGKFPEKTNIIKKMKELNVCNSGVRDRRAGTVQSWLKWIFNLIRL
ncbi:MAG: type II restriction endonuclease, partial [Leptotrichiaceae bacterium]|nr:type II restriction endonuclease [Leptotrichiaceae bacterium]